MPGQDAAADRRRDRGIDVQRPQRTGPGGGPGAGPAGGDDLGGGQRAQPDALSEQDEDGEQQEERLPVLPDPLPREAERALAAFGLLGEGAEPVFAPWRAVPTGRGCCWPCPRWRPPG